MPCILRNNAHRTFKPLSEAAPAPAPPPSRVGGKRTKVSDEMIERMILLRSQGMSAQQIADLLGLSNVTVYEKTRGKSAWRNQRWKDRVNG